MELRPCLTESYKGKSQSRLRTGSEKLVGKRAEEDFPWCTYAFMLHIPISGNSSEIEPKIPLSLFSFVGHILLTSDL